MQQSSHPAAAELWLATPSAADRFDPSSLSGDARAEWALIRTARRRRDWESSRALLQTLPPGDGARSSLAHSRGYAVVARTVAEADPGVDVEWLAPRDFAGMAALAFSAAEARHVASLADDGQRGANFYELWTLKEAFAKALRLPLVDALRQCCFVDGSAAHLATVPTGLHWRAAVFAPRRELRIAVVFVARSWVALPGSPATFEWPPRRAVCWPLVRRLASPGDPQAAC